MSDAAPKVIEVGDRVVVVKAGKRSRERDIGTRGTVLALRGHPDDRFCEVKWDGGVEGCAGLDELSYSRDHLTPQDIEFLYRALRDIYVTELNIHYTMTNGVPTNVTAKLLANILQIDQRLAGKP